ncbi:hypothetical protein Tco_1154429 [Tanacetum coccineum]
MQWPWPISVQASNYAVFRCEGSLSSKLTPNMHDARASVPSITTPIAIAKDVRGVGGKFQFPADFVVVEFEARPPMGYEEYSQESLGFSDRYAYGNPSPCFDPIVDHSSPTLTPFGESDFLLFEEANDFLALDDDTTSPEVDPTYYDPDGDILILEAFLNNEPPTPIPNQGDCSPETQEEIKLLKPKLIDLPNLSDSPRSPDTLGPKKVEVTVVQMKKMEFYPNSNWFTGWVAGMHRTTASSMKPHVKTTLPPVYGSMLERISGKISTIVSLMDSPDDFSVFGNSFENCLSRLEKMLQRCEDTNLCLNWEKSHFMVKEGIVLGHKISKNGIEVDKAKIDVIAKLPHPTTVKGS